MYANRNYLTYCRNLGSNNGLIARSEESYRVCVCVCLSHYVGSRYLKKGGLGPRWTVAPQKNVVICNRKVLNAKVLGFSCMGHWCIYTLKILETSKKYVFAWSSSSTIERIFLYSSLIFRSFSCHCLVIYSEIILNLFERRIIINKFRWPHFPTKPSSCQPPSFQSRWFCAA